MAVADCFDLRVDELLELSASEPAPGAGAAAALAIALAASLVTKVARRSPSWSDGPGVAAQAVELWRRCPQLARDDSAAWLQAFDAFEQPGGSPSDDAALARLLERAAELPAAIARTGADVAQLALAAAEFGNTDLRAEASAAAALAHAGTRIAAHLVAVNLAVGTGDERLAGVDRAEHDAAAAASAALEVRR
jgi:formiminotetrahydrofolate cyclodeaminase